MTISKYIIITFILIITAYAFGRWSAPEKIKEVTKTVEVEKKTETKQSDLDRDIHKKTMVVETTKPDGSVTKTIETTEDNNTHRTSNSTDVDNITKNTETTKEITNSSSKTTILVTYGILFSGGLPQYGGIVSKPVLGPITIGVFGNSSGVGGLGVGLTF